MLVVEGESTVALDIQQTLAHLGYDAFAIASSADEAVARATEKRPDVVLMDVRTKGKLDGISAAQLLQVRYRVPIIYLTADADDATVERAKLAQSYGYLVKPVKARELRSAIEMALQRHDTESDREGRGSTAIPAPERLPPATRPARAPGVRAVRRQLEQVLASADFDASRRSKEFLRFVVEETLAGKGDQITQSAIATRVFGRRDDFDPVVDPIVRIQAGRLRRSLERYYLLSGGQDPMRIELSKGTYVPTFRSVSAPETGAAPVESTPAPEEPVADWPAVAVTLFETVPPGPELEELAVRLQEELTNELGRHGNVRVQRQRRLEAPEPTGRVTPRFGLAGRIHAQGDGLRLTARLLDRISGEQIWADEHHVVPGPRRRSGTPDDVARVIAAGVGSEEGAIVQRLALEHKRDGSAAPTPYGAILRSHDYFLGRDPNALVSAVEALRRVVAVEPEIGPAWTRLARLCMADYAFDVTPMPAPIDEAITCAQRGARLDPTSRIARCVLAAALLVKGELAAGRNALEEALRMHPDSLVYLETIGWLLALHGDWERGIVLARTAVERNPYCLPHVAVGFWADHLRRGEMEQAYQAALEYRDPSLFWRALMRACCLGHLGRDSEARAEVADLLRCKPDFEARGRALIGHFIKFPDLTDRIVDGLAGAGLVLR